MTEDRGDHGNIGDKGEPLGDKGPVPDSDAARKKPLVSSLDMFGNEIKPAAPDRVKGGDKGYVYTPDSSSTTAPANSLQSSSSPANPTSATNSNSPSASSSSGGITAHTSPTKAKSSTKTGYIVVGILALCTAGMLVYKLATGGVGGALQPNEIFRTCTPSLVTVHIVTKALALRLGGAPITLPNSEEPLLLAPNDDVVSLFKDGKPVESAEAVVELKGVKLPLTVRMIDRTPAIFVTMRGRSVRLKAPVELASYTRTAIGSGFFVRPGVVATNFHVVSGPGIGVSGFTGGLAQIPNKPAKYTLTDKPIAFDKDHDLALLYVPGTDAKPMTLVGEYQKLQVGQPVYALGSPKGLAGSISEGLISSDSLRGSDPGDPDSPKLYIQHSAKIDHGNSGGPLVDSHGRVIGVNTAGLGNGAINLAVTAGFVEELLKRPEVQLKIDELNKKSGADLNG